MKNNFDDTDNFGSITGWLYELQGGNRNAVAELWNRYFSKLVGFAKRRLGNNRDRVLDEEDIAIVAFSQFVEGAENGSFRQLDNRADLWQILAMITSRRVHNSKRTKTSRVRIVDLENQDFLEANLQDPSPVFLDDLNESCNELIRKLPSRSQNVAKMKLEGFSNEEIANELELSVATIERELKSIRKSWASILEQA